MARPSKQGVDYFPLDVYLCKKFKFIEMKHGLAGFAITIKLYQYIYSLGYYADWDEDTCVLFADEIGQIGISWKKWWKSARKGKYSIEACMNNMAS